MDSKTQVLHEQSYTSTSDECLKRNKELEMALNKAMVSVQRRLDYIRNRMEEIKNYVSAPGDKFKSQQLLSDWSKSDDCPANADTIAKRAETGGISWWEYSIRHMNKNQTEAWTGVQHRAMTSIIHKMEIERRIKENSDKIHELCWTREKTTNFKKIAALEREVAAFDTDALRKQSLEELVSTGSGWHTGSYDWNKVSQLLHRTHSPIECQARWHQYLHPSINKSPWSKDEDQRLALLAERAGEQDWERLAAELGSGRSAYSCFSAYRFRLRGRRVLDDGTDTEPGWTNEEDSLLSQAVLNSGDVNGVRWDRVSTLLPHRTKRQLQSRWTQVLLPATKRGSLADHEQQALITGVRRFGLDFPSIQKCLLAERSVSQLRHFTLYRINNVTGRGRWLRFTEQVFMALKEFLGADCWQELRSYFPYNSVQQLKRRHEKISQRAENISLCVSPKKKMRMITESNGSISSQELDVEVDDSDSEQRASTSEDGHPDSGSQPALDLHLEDHQQDLPGQNSDEPAAAAASETLGCKRRRGRPPSRKKKREQPATKRPYVRSGRFKAAADTNADTKRTLRSRPGGLES